MTSRAVATLLLLALSQLGTPLGAQRLSVAAGLTKMPGRLGDFDSDHGAVLRIGAALLARRQVTWSVEGSVERLNESRRQFVQQCFLPGGGNGPCHFDSRSRDTGWSLGSTVRISPWLSDVQPYVLVGLGVLRVREQSSTVAVDDQGNRLENFSYSGASSEYALQGHLGGGVTSRPTGWPVAIFVEGRATRLFYGYSGGLYADWNPTVVVGVRW